MAHCRVHGYYADYERGCSDCRDADEELRQSLTELAQKRANPGDYECPHCFYVTLKNRASRCPQCHGRIGSEYWEEVREKERVNTERTAERKRELAAEWNRGAPSRRAAERSKASIERWQAFWNLYFYYLLPIVCVAAATLRFYIDKPGPITFNKQQLLLLIPVANWLVLGIIIVLGEERWPLLTMLLVWSAVGALGLVVNAIRAAFQK